MAETVLYRGVLLKVTVTLIRGAGGEGRSVEAKTSRRVWYLRKYLKCEDQGAAAQGRALSEQRPWWRHACPSSKSSMAATTGRRPGALLPQPRDDECVAVWLTALTGLPGKLWLPSHFSSTSLAPLCCVCCPQPCPTLCDPVDWSPPAPLSRGFSRQEPRGGLPCPPLGGLRTRGRACASHTVGGFFAPSATWEEKAVAPTPVFLLEKPRDGEPGGLPSVGSHRVGHD